MIEYTEAFDPKTPLNPFVNQGEVNGDYTVNPDMPVQSINILSNTLNTDIISIDFINKVSQTNVIVGETILYTLTIVNNSTLDLANLVVKDTDISPYLTISNIKLNGNPVAAQEDLTKGIQISSLIIGDTSAITFDATGFN